MVKCTHSATTPVMWLILEMPNVLFISIQTIKPPYCSSTLGKNSSFMGTAFVFQRSLLLRHAECRMICLQLQLGVVILVHSSGPAQQPGYTIKVERDFRDIEQVIGAHPSASPVLPLVADSDQLIHRNSQLLVAKCTCAWL